MFARLIGRTTGILPYLRAPVSFKRLLGRKRRRAPLSNQNLFALGLADRLNGKAKYVVSSTLQHPAWSNTTVLKGDVVSEASKLKQHVTGDIVVAGSFQLVHTLLDHDLVDELRLMIYPVVLGMGKRLFAETGDKKPMRLVGNKTVAGDLALLTYEPVRET